MGEPHGTERGKQADGENDDDTNAGQHPDCPQEWQDHVGVTIQSLTDRLTGEADHRPERENEEQEDQVNQNQHPVTGRQLTSMVAGAEASASFGREAHQSEQQSGQHSDERQVPSR